MAEAGNQFAANKKNKPPSSKRLAAGAAVCACLLGSIWSYEALGYQKALHFETYHDVDPVSVLENWRSYERWHPIRNVLPFSPGRAVERRVSAIQAQVDALR